MIVSCSFFVITKKTFPYKNQPLFLFSYIINTKNKGRDSLQTERRSIMNKVILMGRLTRDPDIRYSQGEKPTCFARYTLAVDRRFKRDGEPTADFINCIAFGKTAEFAEKYYHQGIKICISGRIQTGSYTNREGQKVYTTDVVVEEQDFAESKSSGSNQVNTAASVQPGYTPAPNPAPYAGQGNSYAAPDPGRQGAYGAPNPAPAGGFVPNQAAYAADGFMNIPDGIDEELPFS